MKKIEFIEIVLRMNPIARAVRFALGLPQPWPIVIKVRKP